MSGENFTDSFLAYGDEIIINNPSSSDVMIFSDGIVKSQIYLEHLGAGSKKLSVQRGLFKIYPAFVNTYKNEALKITTENDSITGGVQRRKAKIHNLKEKLTFEYKFNLEHYEKVKGAPVFYESSIQFLHIASNKFLACSFDEALVEKENYLLDLIDTPSEATGFKILPSYKHQEENEGYIYYQDLIHIACNTSFLNKASYIHCNFQYKSRLEPGHETFNDNTYYRSPETKKTKLFNSTNNDQSIGFNFKLEAKVENRISVQNKERERREVNISVIDSTRWKISLFQKEVDHESFLSYGEVIWINHAEFNASMTIKRTKDKVYEIYFIRNGISENSQDYIGNTNGMWVIEHENYLRGGLVQWGDTFRLKHFSSDMYLSIDEQHNSFKLDKIRPDRNDENFLFHFVVVSSTINSEDPTHFTYVSKEAFARIQSVASEKWLHVIQDSDKMQAVQQEEFSDDDVFKIFRANNDEIWETNFLKSCFPILKNYLSILEPDYEKV